MTSCIPTYEDQMQLVKLKYARRSATDKFEVFKYSKHVMYDYLWDELKHIHILECRGHVYDAKTKELVQLPPRKTFNYLENDTWGNIPLNQLCIGYKKYNGYMACATIHAGEIVVSTTGTVNSDFARYAKDQIISNKSIKSLLDENITTVFEIVAPWDKHIVDEDSGVYVLGTRYKLTGTWIPEGEAVVKTLGEFIEDAKTNKTEGWVLYILGLAENISCKLKSDYYVGKKKLMRMTSKVVHDLYNFSRSVENKLPDQWKFAVEQIKKDFTVQDEWATMQSLTRREYLEKIYKEEYLE